MSYTVGWDGSAACAMGVHTAEKREIVSSYDNEAPRYDASSNRPFYDRGYGGRRERALLASVFRGTHALDLACGTGRLLGFLVERSTLTVGNDLSAHMLQVAHRKHMAAHLVRCDVDFLPFRDSTFDMACCSRAFKFFPNPQVTLAEAQRCLKNEGKLTISLETGDPLWIRLIATLGLAWLAGIPDTKYHWQVVHGMLSRAGFKTIATRCVYYFPRYVYEGAPRFILSLLGRFDDRMKSGRVTMFVARKALVPA